MLINAIQKLQAGDEAPTYRMEIMEYSRLQASIIMAVAPAFGVSASTYTDYVAGEWIILTSETEDRMRYVRDVVQAIDFDSIHAPALEPLEVPSKDARMEAMVAQAAAIADRHRSTSGVLTLEWALLEILGIPGGQVLYDPQPNKGSHVMAVPAHDLAGMVPLMVMEHQYLETIFRLRLELEDIVEPGPDLLGMWMRKAAAEQAPADEDAGYE